MSDAQSAASLQILEAAVRSLAAKGSANVSLRDIAREASVALSQIHYYFGSRERLLAAATSFVMQRQIASLHDELAGVRNPADRVSLAIRFVRRHLRLDPSQAKILLDLLSAATWSAEVAAETRPLQDKLLDVILAESAYASQDCLKTRAVARLVLGALNGLALQALQGAPEEEMDAAYAALESILIELITQERKTDDE